LLAAVLFLPPTVAGAARNHPALRPAGQVRTMKVTAYCPCRECCGPRACGITASGRPARGKIIAAPASVPFGTWITVPGYGRAQVLDRGGAIRGNRLDVLMPTHAKALRWGVRVLKVCVESNGGT